MQQIKVDTVLLQRKTLGVSTTMRHNVISLGEVADFGKINFQLKNKYDAKRERE